MDSIIHPFKTQTLVLSFKYENELTMFTFLQMKLIFLNFASGLNKLIRSYHALVTFLIIFFGVGEGGVGK